MTPIAAAIAAEAVVVIAIIMGAAIIVNGHSIWAVLIGVVG
jgi:hypothetical protein